MKRLNPAAGVTSALATVVGLTLLVYQEVDAKADHDIIDFYGDRGNRIVQLFGFSLVLAGAMLFLVFLDELRRRSKAAGSGAESFTGLAFGAGVAATPLMVGAGALLAVMSAGLQFSDRYEIEPNLARHTVGAGYLMLTGSVMISCVMVFATSLLFLRTRIMPRWLGWLGIALVVIAVAEAFLLAIFAIPLWVLIASIVMFVRSDADVRRES